MRIKVYFAIGLIFMTLQFGANAQSPQIKFGFPGLYPEGVTFNPTSKLFYVSSVTTAAIGSVDMKGNYKLVFQDSTMKSTYGLKIDPTGKVLWACVSDANYSKYSNPSTFKKKARIIAVDLTSGKKVKDIDLASLSEGKHFINDIAFDNDGNMYATDSFSPVIFKVDKGGTASVFVKNDLFKSQDIGLNGIAFHTDGFLIVNNNSAGALLKVGIKDPGKISRVKVKNLFPGADGMLFDKSGNLVLVQNKGVDKVFQLASKDGWQSAEVIASTSAEDRFQQPSTNTLADNQVYVLNSKLNELSDPIKRPSKEFTIQLVQFRPVK